MTTATGSQPAQEARAALRDRLRAAAQALDLGVESDPDPAADAAAVLDRLTAALSDDPAPDKIWLVLTALSTVFPTRDEVDEVRRRLELDTVAQASLFLLDSSLERAQRFGEPLAGIEVVTHCVLVDVDHTAKFNLHTGIQRVARNLLPHWDAAHGVVTAAWTPGGGSYRRLGERERERVLEWPRRGDAGEGQQGGGEKNPGDRPPRLLVPWRSVVVMAEVPPATVTDRIAALGAYSGNRVVGIGYDAIPVVSADMVPPADTTKFVRYLTAIKFASRIAGISTAATAEIGGFVQMLPTQGLTGPTVLEVSLPSPATGRPAEPDHGPRTGPADASTPMVLVVGSHEPRKNHLAVLHAAEVLWREGLRFTLRFIGGSGWGEDFPRRAADLAAAGRPVEVLRSVGDRTLDHSLTQALFTVFPSLHEGYGLPVVESFTHGTPAITSNFGSTAEIAAQGGALTVDPRDDGALTAAMRTLLTDTAVLAQLRHEIAARRDRTWADYAAELWEKLVAPELAALTTGSRRPWVEREGRVAGHVHHSVR